MLCVLFLQVTVDRPDVQGRIAILKVHSRGKTLAPDVDFEKVARRTPGALQPRRPAVTSSADSSFRTSARRHTVGLATLVPLKQLLTGAYCMHLLAQAIADNDRVVVICLCDVHP